MTSEQRAAANFARMLRADYIKQLTKTPNEHVLVEIRQLLCDVMDILEQTPEEVPIICAYEALEDGIKYGKKSF